MQIVNGKIIESKNAENTQVISKNLDTQITFFEQEYMTISAGGGYVVVDFFKEMNGGVIISTFDMGSSKQIKVRIRFGESLSEASSEIGEKNSTNDHSTRDFTIDISFMSTVEIGKTGYRFVRVDFFNEEEIKIKAIKGTNNILRQRAIYSYNGSDKEIKKIFCAAKRTVDLCSSSDYIWDGLKRDRLVWAGDLYPATLALITLYGKCKVIENSLSLESKRTKMNGIWLCEFSTYNMWWVICLSEYYLRLGKEVESFVITQLDFLNQNIKEFNKCILENGDFNFPCGIKLFVDWQSKDDEEETTTGSRYIFIIGVKKAIQLLKKLNLDFAVAENLLNKLVKGVKESNRKQVIGLKYLAMGEINDYEFSKLIEGGTEGFSTFRSYEILSAIASRDKRLAIELMKQYYGTMLKKGATTFWEDFNIKWAENSSSISEYPKLDEKDIHGDFGEYCYKGFRHSLCHAWSSGIIKFIKDNCR